MNKIDSSFWTETEILEQFQQKPEINQGKLVLDFSAKLFKEETFQILLKSLEQRTVKKILLDRDKITLDQAEKMECLANSNFMKGLKINHKDGTAFSSVDTDWSHSYLEAKIEAIANPSEDTGLRLTTLEAIKMLKTFSPTKSPENPFTMIDFGAYTGQDTVPILKGTGQEMLEPQYRLQKGECRVFAIDGEEEGLKVYQSRLTEEELAFVSFHTMPFMEFTCQPVDIFISSYTWPYRPEKDFTACFEKTVKLVKAGGLLAGHFFGPPENPKTSMTYHTKEQLERLMVKFGLEILFFKNDNSQKICGGDGTKPYGDLFHVVARKVTD